MKTLLLFLSLTLASFQCKKDTALPAIESMTFGMVYCHCQSNCVISYKLSGGQLFADNMDLCKDPAAYQATPMPDAKYLLAKPLLDNFPPALYNNGNKVIGCPDCLDQGGLKIEIKLADGSTRAWHIDIKDHPQDIAAYIGQVYSTIQQL